MQTRLTQKLGQQLALTPQLNLSLKVLAMNTIELDEYVKQCLESNPLIEAEQLSEDQGADTPRAADSTDMWRESGDNRWEQMYTPSAVQDEGFQGQQIRQEKSLYASLHEQIDCQPMQDGDRLIAHAIIDSLEDDGYFRIPPEELADTLKTVPEAVTRVLEDIVQQMEPAGIGARNLTECLLLQLDPNDPTDALVQRLLLRFSAHLLESDASLARRAGCGEQAVVLARARMRRLDPFPGHGMQENENIYIRPEIIFRRTADGSYQIEIPAYSWRGIHISEAWKDHRWQGKEADFMATASREAKWLMYALDQRQTTLLKVARCLARRQADFLEHGVLGLKPLTLKEVADEVGLHESTISRVTRGKYAETPLGLIELRRFFSAGLPTRSGQAISVHRVQQRVKALIESEPPGRPISDQALADRLRTEGIEIARRTAAKYREQLGIPPSSQRKRLAMTQ